jgi:hypothetical protein
MNALQHWLRTKSFGHTVHSLVSSESQYGSGVGGDVGFGVGVVGL